MLHGENREGPIGKRRIGVAVEALADRRGGLRLQLGPLGTNLRFERVASGDPRSRCARPVRAAHDPLVRRNGQVAGTWPLEWA